MEKPSFFPSDQISYYLGRIVTWRSTRTNPKPIDVYLNPDTSSARTRNESASAQSNHDLADDQPSIVEISPASVPASFALRIRRRIFPDLVLGSDATNS